VKIGIITFQRAHNYGAALQAYALMTTLKRYGHEVEFIDYWPDYRKGMYDLINFSFLKDPSTGLLFKLKKLVTVFLKLPRNVPRNRKFNQFFQKELDLAINSKYTKGEKIVDDCDLYVFGSDQIWRYNQLFLFQKGFDAVYWGKYPVTAKRKIAYAASMGVMEMDEDKRKFVKEHLQNFSAISVRENYLKEFISSLSEIPVSQVLDPVFLLEKHDWQKLSCLNKTPPKEKYILFYHLLFSAEALKLVDRLAKHYSLTIIEIGGIKKRSFAGPIGFVNLISQADFVVSTSFHGAAFSIIFQKQFYALGMKKNSGRVQSLLASLAIPDRLVDKAEQVDLDEIINYEEVACKLDAQKRESLEFLKREIVDLPQKRIM
jgi:polysaccharide pyruvyl transferase WcaK-like protein